MTSIPPLRSDQPDSPMRLGVFVCDCGNKISGRLDTECLQHEAALLPGVIYAAREAYPCSPDGRQRISQAIQEKNMERVLVAGCAPRLVEKLFQETAISAGLDRDDLQIVDIREQCAFVHPDGIAEAQTKAGDLIEMGIANLSNRIPYQPVSSRVNRSALIFGGSLAGLTSAVELARSGILVTLAVPGEQLVKIPLWADQQYRDILSKQVDEISNHPQIFPLIGARILDVSGDPGSYHATIAHDGQTTSITAGAILVAEDPQPINLGVESWYDREQVKTQAEYTIELEAGKKFTDIVMVFCNTDEHCSRLCCQIGIQQALQTRRLHPQANITILFRELFLSRYDGDSEDLLKQAAEQGITFFRYSKSSPPVINEKGVSLYDPLTEEVLEIPADRVVLARPLHPDRKIKQLAALLHLAGDNQGFLVQPRIRLRPGHYAEDGIFVLGGSHQPSNLQESLFQAYLTTARVQRFLSQEFINKSSTTAQVDSGLCTGCAECIPICSARALHLETRQSVLSLATVDPFHCTGCGDCVVACPVKAVTLPGWDDPAILAQITAALRPAREKTDASGITHPLLRVLVLACEWSAYAAADIAGARQKPYPSNVRIIRMGCSARFDPGHILWAFLNGAQGVFLGACPIGDCHHGNGNMHARERVYALKQQLAEHAIDPKRLRLEFLEADDGAGFARAMNQFVQEISEVSGSPIRTN